jgi:hypothetical protein
VIIRKSRVKLIDRAAVAPAATFYNIDNALNWTRFRQFELVIDRAQHNSSSSGYELLARSSAPASIGALHDHVQLVSTTAAAAPSAIAGALDTSVPLTGASSVLASGLGCSVLLNVWGDASFCHFRGHLVYETASAKTVRQIAGFVNAAVAGFRLNRSSGSDNIDSIARVALWGIR